MRIDSRRMLRPFIFGVCLAYIEFVPHHLSAYATGALSPIDIAYRAAYYIMLFVAWFNQSVTLWVRNVLLAALTQDAGFWTLMFFFSGRLPYGWAVYYPVWSNIPLLYVPVLVAIGVLTLRLGGQGSFRAPVRFERIQQDKSSKPQQGRP